MTAVQGHLFVSYCRADIGYVRRLTDHLQGNGLPVWWDTTMEWGQQRFPRHIRDRIRTAAGVIVVMSDRSQESDWVELEILEAMRADRPLLPILVSGETHFLLASTHYVDARSGTLPAAAYLRRLRNLLRGDDAPAPYSPAFVPAEHRTSRPPQRIRLTASDLTAPDLTAPDLKRISAYIDGGALADADILTTTALLEVAGRAREGWLREVDSAALPVPLLDALDALWATATSGRHSFGRQRTLSDHPRFQSRPTSGEDFRRLAAMVGWRANGPVFPRYGEFLRAADAPGFFPTLRNPQQERLGGWFDRWYQTVITVHRRLARR